VELVGRHGHRLKIAHNRTNDLPRVWRHGAEHDWRTHRDVYRPVNATAPISLAWRSGTLRVEAGGKVFEQSVSSNGAVTFSER
jgi:hypothetical protein